MEKNHHAELPEPNIEVITFTAAGVALDGILTLPSEECPHTAIALLHGSDRSGKEDPYYTIKVEDDFAPGYFDTINNWLRMRFEELMSTQTFSLFTREQHPNG